MLTLLGPPRAACDGVRRRDFLRIGGLGLGAAALARPAQAVNPGRPSGHKAVINVFLAGGPPQHDTFDPKPDAPSEVRGDLRSIPTAIPGVRFGECFPRLARLADRLAVLRSVVGSRGGHDAAQCTTGWPGDSLKPIGGRPSLGAAMSRLAGPADPAVPPFVGLTPSAGHAPWADPGAPGFLGPAHAAFRPSGPDLQNMVLAGVNRDRLDDRKALLAGFDTLNRQIDAGGRIGAADEATRRALDVLASPRLVHALDLSREDPRVRARYGDGLPYRHMHDGAPTANDQLLVARRLVEAGVRVVTLSYGRWDAHANNADVVRDHGTKLDQGLSALIEDLEARGLLDDVAVVAWGEFGRTPRLNAQGGRDHWPQVSCALLAGGGLRVGQAVGSTNRLGEDARDRPVTFADVFATLYHTLGVNPATTTLSDPTGRPQHLTDGTVIRELV